MTVVNIHKAKTDLSRLIAMVEAGEEVIISRRNVPVAKIVPARAEESRKRIPGVLASVRGNMPSDIFLEPGDPAEFDEWEGVFSEPDQV